jgi:hypothetical protein
LVPYLLGLIGLAALLREKLGELDYLERPALAFGLGLWSLIVLMFLLGLINIPLTALNISLSALLVICCLLPWAYKQLAFFLPRTLPKSENILFYLILLAIIVKIIFALYSSLIQPVFAPDPITNYTLSAKHTFLLKLPLYRCGEPPFPNLIESWVALSLGEWNDTLLGIFYPLLLISFAAIFFATLRRTRDELTSLLFTFLAVSLPFLLYHTGTVYADWPQAFYYGVSTIYLYLFFKERSFTRLLISLLFLGASVWVKKSGLFFVGINLSVLVLFLAANRISVRKTLWGLAGLAAIPLPWLIFNHFGTWVELVGSGPIMTASGAGVNSLTVIMMLARNLFLEGNWQLLWGLFVAVLVLYPKKAFSSSRAYLLAIIGLQLLAFFIYFRFTASGTPFVFDNSLTNRLMLPLMPLVLYFCAETWPEA